MARFELFFTFKLKCSGKQAVHFHAIGGTVLARASSSISASWKEVIGTCINKSIYRNCARRPMHSESTLLVSVSSQQPQFVRTIISLHENVAVHSAHAARPRLSMKDACKAHADLCRSAKAKTTCRNLRGSEHLSIGGTKQEHQRPTWARTDRSAAHIRLPRSLHACIGRGRGHPSPRKHPPPGP
jgi:hypothetical protein